MPHVFALMSLKRDTNNIIHVTDIKESSIVVNRKLTFSFLSDILTVIRSFDISTYFYL